MTKTPVNDLEDWLRTDINFEFELQCKLMRVRNFLGNEKIKT